MAGSAVDGINLHSMRSRVGVAALLGWLNTTRRMRVALALVGFSIFTIFFLRPSNSPAMPRLPAAPSITLEYGPGRPESHASTYNATKLALLIENRATPTLAPLMLHFMSVVPPDWRFRFMGSEDSVAALNGSRAIRDAVDDGKLDLTYIPSNMTTGSQEEISQVLTSLWLYEQVLHPAEWLLLFQTDSMLCANSRQSLNSWLEYDWVGAPWSPSARFGGNGGLSLRRVSAIMEILRSEDRLPYSEPEDVWLSLRLGHRPGAKLANGTASLAFSGEEYSGKEESVKENGELRSDLMKGIDDWRDGFYEPMGYHTGSGEFLHPQIWGTQALRQHIWRYCPEVKIILPMDAAQYVPGNCEAAVKRDLGFEGYENPDDGSEKGGTELIDGVEYPILPAGLVAW